MSLEISPSSLHQLRLSSPTSNLDTDFAFSSSTDLLQEPASSDLRQRRSTQAEAIGSDINSGEEVIQKETITATATTTIGHFGQEPHPLPESLPSEPLSPFSEQQPQQEQEAQNPKQPQDPEMFKQRETSGLPHHFKPSTGSSSSFTDADDKYGKIPRVGHSTKVTKTDQSGRADRHET